MQSNIDVSVENRKNSAHLLNLLLADEFVLYAQTLNFHWNVESLHFRDLHKFFQDQYEEILEVVDSVAERVRAIGHHSLGTMQEYLEHTRLIELSGKGLSDKEMLKKLLEDHEAIIRTLRVDQEIAMTEFKDAGTSNFLLNLLEQHEKIAWMLRSCL